MFVVEQDTHKTTFRCLDGLEIYGWIVMHFRLKNDGTSYSTAMNAIFHGLIGKNRRGIH